jgi:hypothetical protein
MTSREDQLRAESVRRAEAVAATEDRVAKTVDTQEAGSTPAAVGGRPPPTRLNARPGPGVLTAR